MGVQDDLSHSGRKVSWTTWVVSLGAASNFHLRTASAAASTRTGLPPRTRVARTLPFGRTMASTLTTPCRRIFRASSGYCGSTRNVTLRSGVAGAAGAGVSWAKAKLAKTHKKMAVKVRRLPKVPSEPLAYRRNNPPSKAPKALDLRTKVPARRAEWLHHKWLQVNQNPTTYAIGNKSVPGSRSSGGRSLHERCGAH